MTFHVNTIMIIEKVMIDSEILHDFIFQFKIKEYNFVEIDIQFQNFWCFDDVVLRIYKFHNLNVDMIDQHNAKTRSQQSFIKIDIIDVNMILDCRFYRTLILSSIDRFKSYNDDFLKA